MTDRNDLPDRLHVLRQALASSSRGDDFPVLHVSSTSRQPVSARTMSLAEARRQFLQYEANKWLRRFRGRGLIVPTRVLVFTNLRAFDRASGIKRWERMRIMDEVGRDFLRGDSNPEHVRAGSTAAIYVNTNEHMTGKDPARVLIHEVLHHVVPRLPHWKVYALERELTAGRSGRPVWEARTRAEYIAATTRQRPRAK